MKLFLLLLALPAGLIQADDNHLSLTSVTTETLARNPSIRAAASKWNAARARIPQARAWDDPKISLDITAGRFVDMPPNSMADQMLSIEQMIPISGKNISRARIAAAEALLTYEQMRRAEFDAVAKARAAFFQLLNIRAQIGINSANIESLQQVASIARTRYMTGSETAPDTVTAEIEASKLEENEQDLQRSLSDAESQLNVLMDRDPFASPLKTTTKSIRTPNVSLERLRSALPNRPEVRMAVNQIEVEKARLELARREWIPDPAISVNAQRYNEASQAVSQAGVGISFSVPWVNRGKYSAGIREASENLAAAQSELQRVHTESLGMLRDQLRKIQTAHHHYELFNSKIAAQAQQAFVAMQINYETGKAGFRDWITTQRAVRDAQSMARQKLAEYQTAIAELEALVGTDLYLSERTAPKNPTD